MAEIPNMTRELAFLLGNAVRQGLIGGREPVAYLYNGVRLPKLPEWDRSKYPYATITRYHIVSKLYLLSFWSEKPSRCIDADGDAYLGVSEGADSVEFTYNSESAEGKTWEFSKSFGSDNPATHQAIGIYSLKWSSVDVLSEDGTVFFEASAPVPVYE